MVAGSNFLQRFPLLAAIFFVFVFTFLQSHIFVPIGHNDSSRWNTIYSLVHHGSYTYRSVPWPQSLDQMAFESEGETVYASSKPAFWATIAAPVYKVATIIGWDLDEKGSSTKSAIDFVLFWINIIPFGFAVYWFLNFCLKHELSFPALLIAASIVGSGTYMTGYLFTLNNHLPAAVFTMGSLWFLYIGKEKSDAAKFWCCGLFAGLAFAVELSAAVWLAAVAISLSLSRDRNFLAFAAGAVLPIFSYFFIERMAYGWWLPNQIQHLMGWGSKVYYQGSPWHEAIKAVPIHNIKESFWQKLLHLTFGHHGIFALTPVFAFSVYSATSRLNESRECRHLALLTLSAPLVVILAYAYHTNNYGGVCQGPRWLLWLIPFWLWQLPKVLNVYQKSRCIFALLILTAAISVYSALSALPSPWTESWWHLYLRSLGVVNY